MIDVYFIRHGETSGNAAHRHQVSTSRLTPRGRQQAAEVSVRLEEISPTHFITSSQIRAVETAQIIGAHLNVEPETSPLFAELQRPATINGHYHRSLASIKYLILWYFDKVGGEDEVEGETYRAFRARIAKAREQLESLPDGSRVLVVSHSVFMTLFLAHMCDSNRLLPWRAAKYLWRVFMVRNTGMVHVRFAPEHVNTECPWRVPRIR